KPSQPPVTVFETPNGSLQFDTHARGWKATREFRVDGAKSVEEAIAATISVMNLYGGAVHASSLEMTLRLPLTCQTLAHGKRGGRIAHLVTAFYFSSSADFPRSYAAIETSPPVAPSQDLR